VMCVRADGAEVSEVVRGAGVSPIGPEAFESLRIEAGTPLFGHDVDESVLLPEIPFENLLSHTKGCYPGQEVVVRIRDRGHVNRMLRGLAIDGDQVPGEGAEVLADDTTIGECTSAAPWRRRGTRCLEREPRSWPTTRRSARSRARPGRSASRARLPWRSFAASTPSRARVCRFVSPARRWRPRSARCRSRADDAVADNRLAQETS